MLYVFVDVMFVALAMCGGDGGFNVPNLAACQSNDEREAKVSPEEYRSKIEGFFAVRHFLLRPSAPATTSFLNIDRAEYETALRESLTINQEFIQTFHSYRDIEPAIVREGLENTCRELRDAKLNELYRARFSEEVRRRIAEVCFQESFAQLLLTDSDLHSCLELTEDDIAGFFEEVFGKEEGDRLFSRRSSVAIIAPRFKPRSPERPENAYAYVLFKRLTLEQQELLDDLLGEPIPNGWLEYAEQHPDTDEQ